MGFLGLLENKLLLESASVENVTRAMDNHSKVIINYKSKGKDEHNGSRVIEPVCYGLTKAGNPVIRAYQPYGDTTTKTPGWKFFRLDRITYWEETNVKFGEIPEFDEKELNKDGDNTMSVVIKTYSTTEGTDATNGVNIGPKTKEKVFAKTSGDESLSIGQRNLERLKNGVIKIDLDNNRKANNGFKIATSQPEQTQKSKQPTEQQPKQNKQNTTDNTTGPKFPNQDTKPRAVETNGSVENGDIDKEELDKAREIVYNNSYATEPSDEDFMTKADFDKRIENNLKRRDRRWEKSSDSRFLNRKNSGNRMLYDMEHQKDEEDED